MKKLRRSPVFKPIVALLIASIASGSAPVIKQPYSGVNRENSQFERGISMPPLDLLGDLLAKLPQLLFWSRTYGNHQITPDTEAAIVEF